MSDKVDKMLEMIFNSAERAVPKTCHMMLVKASKTKKTSNLVQLTHELIKFAMDIMQHSLRAGIELGNNGMTNEKLKVWFKQYALNKIKDIPSEMFDELREKLGDDAIDEVIKEIDDIKEKMDDSSSEDEDEDEDEDEEEDIKHKKRQEFWGQ